MLRYRDFKLNKSALTAALAEEKALGLEVTKKTVNCKICGRSNHSTQNCYRNKANIKPSPKSNPINFNQKPTATTTNEQQIKICRYCKNLGHNIDECRKTQFNNSRRQNYNPSRSNQTPDNASNATNVHFQQSNFRVAQPPLKPPISAEIATIDFNDYPM